MNQSTYRWQSLQDCWRPASFLVLWSAVASFAGCDQAAEIAQNFQGEETTDPAAPAEPGQVPPTTVNQPVPNQSSTDSESPAVTPADPPQQPAVPPALTPAQLLENLNNTESPEVTDELLKSVAELDQSHLLEITELDLSKSKVTNEGLEYLKQFPNLERLIIEKFDLSPAGATFIASHPNITSLSVANKKLGMDTLAAILGAVQLRALDLTATEITDEHVEKLAALINLDELVLDKNASLRGSTIAAVLKNCPNLRVLKVSDTNFAPIGFPALKGSKIEELHAKTSGANGQAMARLRDCKTIKLLDLSENNSIGNLEITALKPLARSLEDLNVSGSNQTNPLAAEAFNTFATMKKLKRLNIVATRSPAGYVEKLRGMLKNCEIVWDGQ